MKKGAKPKSREERNAMQKIARKIKRGESLTPEDASFRENYIATRSPRGKPPLPLTPRPANPPAPSPPAQSIVDGPPETPRAPEPEHARVHASPPRRTLTPYDAAPAPAANGEPAPEALVHRPRYDPAPAGCGSPGCIYCTAEPGKLTCQVTGKTYFEPIDNDSAEALGEAMLGLVGWLTRIARTVVKNENVSVDPNEKETRKMRKGVQKLAHRRANWLGGVEEFVLIGVATVSYGSRAFSEAPRATPAK